MRFACRGGDAFAHGIVPPCQVRVSSHFGGLSFWMPKKLRDGSLPPWREWNHISFSFDQGSDQVSAGHAMCYHEPTKLCTTMFWDPSHGCNRDCWNAINDLNLGPLFLMFMIVMNINHGPDDSDLRYQQIKDTMAAHFRDHRPSTSPIFGALSREIHREFEHLEVSPGESVETTLWNAMAEDSFFKRLGEKVNKARFMAIIKGGQELVRRWFTWLFEVSVTCIELDFVNDRMADRVTLKGAMGIVSHDGESTSRKHISAADKTIRSCGGNAVAISLGVLSEYGNLRVLASVVSLCEPTLAWMGTASATLRDTTASQAWLLAQVRGASLKVVDATLSILCEEDFMRRARFLNSTSRALLNLTNDEQSYEDECADLAGNFALSMVKARLRRMLYLVEGYPHKFVLLLGSDDESGGILRALRSDCEIFDELKALNRPSALLRRVMARSPLQMLSVQQVALACIEFGWAPHAELRRLVDERTRTIMQSQACEDLNNHQKNFRQHTNWGGHYRRPLTCMAATVRGEVMSKMHRFELPDMSAAHRVPIRTLERHDLVPKNPTIDTSSVVGHSQQATYFSPNAENIGVGVADLFVLRALHAKGRLAHFADVWHGWWCDASHGLVCREFRSGQHEWFLPLYHYKESAVLCIPVELVTIAAFGMQQIVKFLPNHEPMVKPIFDYRAYECRRFQWRSWAWQAAKLGEARLDQLLPGVRPVCLGRTAESVLHAAAESGWWQLPRATLLAIADEIGIMYDEGTNMMELLSMMTKQVLGCNDEKCMSLLERRLTAPLRAAQVNSAILQVDEAQACLREDDFIELTKEKKRVENQVQEEADFRRQFHERASRVRNVKAGKRGGISGYKGPRKLPDPTAHMSQAEAKKLMPPNSYLWRARTQNAWNGRYNQLPSRSARDSAHGGEQQALMCVIRYVWQCYLEVYGCPTSDCPIEGLFPKGNEAASSSSS